MAKELTERCKYDEEFLKTLTRIETIQETVIERLNKINGSISDYQTTKEKLHNACQDIEQLDADLNNKVVPMLSSIKIKVWSAAGLIGAFSAFIGIMVGKFI